ncbi:MAG: hypothetical protein Q7J35_14280 [Candidatus Methanoperedens sp.]|nr:hypothetical protein [Candidatus Methanoperedens sp.]
MNPDQKELQKVPVVKQSKAMCENKENIVARRNLGIYYLPEGGAYGCIPV